MHELGGTKWALLLYRNSVRETDMSLDAAILYTDYSVTLPREIEYIWRHPTSRPSLIFYVNRYIPLFGDFGIAMYG